MEDLDKIEERLQYMEYRLGVLEKFLDRNGLLNAYKGEVSDINAIRVEVLQDMRKDLKHLRVNFNKEWGRDFYNKKSK